MVRQQLFVLACIFHLLIVQFAFARVHFDEADDDSGNDADAYSILKRFLFDKSTTHATQRTPSVLDNLVHPSLTRSSTQRPGIVTQKSTPSYPSSNPCVSNPCDHGGICYPQGQMTYECKCVGPWRGLYCGIPDACYKSPCQNGGACLNVYDDYWCKCTNDYYGTNCQTRVNNPSSLGNNCRPNVCNTGRCVSLQTTYYCQCPDDRYGEYCEKRFSKRKISDVQSYYNLLGQMKRSKHAKN